jgi:hypothetical protein
MQVMRYFHHTFKILIRAVMLLHSRLLGQYRYIVRVVRCQCEIDILRWWRGGCLRIPGKISPENSKRDSDADAPRETCHLMGCSGQFGVTNKIWREK